MTCRKTGPFAASPSSAPASSAQAGLRYISPAGRCDGHRAERGSCAEEVCGGRLAGAQEIGPLIGSVAVEPEVHGRASQPVAGVDLVQENGPERINFKRKLYGELDELLPPPNPRDASSLYQRQGIVGKGALLCPPTSIGTSGVSNE